MKIKRKKKKKLCSGDLINESPIGVIIKYMTSTSKYPAFL